MCVLHSTMLRLPIRVMKSLNEVEAPVINPYGGVEGPVPLLILLSSLLSS
jgi:hypothetical protein